MEPRSAIAYGLIVLLVAAAALGLWLRAISRSRRQQSYRQRRDLRRARESAAAAGLGPD